MSHGVGTPRHALIVAGGAASWAALLALAASGSEVWDATASLIAFMPCAGLTGAVCLLCCREGERGAVSARCRVAEAGHGGG